MRTYKLQWLSIFFLVLVFSSQAASAGLFDNDEQNWRRIFGEIKKINARLVSLEMGKLKALENTQQDLFRQIEEIKNLIPNLQGTVEQSQAEISGNFKATNQKLADIEAQIKQEIIRSVNQQLDKIEVQIATQLSQQKVANDQFQGNLANKFSDLKGGMAADMENFAKGNQKSFQDLARYNSESLSKVVEQLNIQKQSLDRANEIIKSELIPTIIKQNEDSSAQLRAEMSRTSTTLLTGMSQARRENAEALMAGLRGIEAKNQKLLEVLSTSLKEGEITRGNIELLSQNMGATNENLVRTNDNIVKLKDVMGQQLETLAKGQQNLTVQVDAGSQKIDQKVDIVFRNLKVADEKINKLAESQSGLQSQGLATRTDLTSLQQKMTKVREDNALMGQSVTQLATHSGEVNQSLQSVGQALQTIQGGLANVDNVNEKLTTLIGILKTIASEQGKFSEIISSQDAIKQTQNQISKSQMELNQVQVKMSQVQGEMSKAQFQMGKNQGVINQTQLDEKQVQEQLNQKQARILKAQQEIKGVQSQILKAQQEIKNAQNQTIKTQGAVQKNLADLSRKANVNISRNDAIRKTLSSLGKKSLPPAPGKN